MVLEQPLNECHDAVEQWLERSRVWLATDGVTVLGFAVTDQSFFGNKFVELVRVLPAARRRGVASGLLAAVSAARRTPKLFTSTNLSNHPMQLVLATLGWTFAGIVYGLDDGDPELFYQAPSH
ncbi:GNAT family N-acetyltransferase [Curtobacterium sp. 22159]|uniref:GNAT family N-acetyltransferase n=1 Tax=Curtobacterium sp. 22159 TaxID=3453882 RepID=UPI003F8648C7